MAEEMRPEDIPDYTPNYIYKSDAKPALNPNKVIHLYRFGKAEKDYSWRNTISSIFQHLKSEEGNSLSNYMFPTSEIDVDPGIELLMTEDPEKFKNSFSTTTPIRSFFDKVTTLAGKYGEYAKIAWNVVETGINAVSAVKTGFDSNGFNTSKQITPWVTGAPSWDGNTKPLTFSYPFTFSMGQYGLWDAKKEVMIPAFNLIAPVFPQYLDAAYVAGPIPNSMNFATNLIGSFFGKGNKTESSSNTSTDDATDDHPDDNFISGIARWIDELLLGAYENFLWDIDFGGHLKMRRCIIQNGDLEFSKETDENGFPVYAKVTLQFISMLPPALSSDSGRHMAMRFEG